MFGALFPSKNAPFDGLARLLVWCGPRISLCFRGRVGGLVLPGRGFLR